MVNCVPPKDEGFKDVLKPFYQRAADAENRLSRIEASLCSKKGAVEPANEESTKKVEELEVKLEEMKKELAADREKVAKLTTENDKKDYRIIHLIHSIREADLKLEKLASK